jgi:superfamily II DNA or RNA helicase
MRITIGPIWSKADSNLPMIKSILTFKYSAYRPGEFGGKHVEYWKNVMSKEGEFLTGYVPRIVKKLLERNIPIEYTTLSPAPQPSPEQLRTKTLYDYQAEAVKIALARKRGVIVSSTGSGKTLIGLGIVKNFPHQNILWIAPTIDLLNQTYQRFLEEFDAPEIGIIGDGTFEPSRITIGIVNSLYNSRMESSFLHGIGVIIVDECHRVSKLTGMYAKTLQKVPAAFRIGLTATPSKDPEALWSCEGNIGPIIKEISTDHLTSIGKLATPKVKIIPIPKDNEIANIRKYSEVYQMGVVHNVKRNEIIVNEIANQVLKSNTVLVITKILDHGQNLINMLKGKYPLIRSFLAQGWTEGEERERIRQALEARTIDVAITSTIWKEGVDIPSLNVVVNAAGGKSEIFTLQAVGRGMRAAPGKDTFLIVDFFDPSSRYLVDHFGTRICLYYDKGWMA